jgi:hypothetical protein
MRALTPAPLTPAAGLPAYCATPSCRSISNHAVCPGIALAATSACRAVFGLRLTLAGSPHHLAESSSSPTDRQFASGCSPPRLAATQLPSATELWLTPARTFTTLISRPHGRTSAGASPAAAQSAAENAPFPPIPELCRHGHGDHVPSNDCRGPAIPGMDEGPEEVPNGAARRTPTRRRRSAAG